MATNNNGLTYYKLDSTLHGYPGDFTKNSGLRGEEIDGNFNFLRGNDIKTLSFDDAGTMTITKYNGETLKANIVQQEYNYDFSYDPNKGALTIISPSGVETVLEGFNIATNVHADVYHDNSLVGLGSMDSILQISNINKTGRYLPAIKLIDTTLKDEDGNQIEKLPTENIARNDRYVTKEDISIFGKLYSVKGMEKIAKRLKEINSEWHVPSKEEWDELLNVIDFNVDNHDSSGSTVELGEFAGTVLKSIKYWERLENGKLLSEDVYGFSVLPVGYCGNRGKSFFGSLGKLAAFWTSTLEDTDSNMYVKTFSFDKETVGQSSWGEDYYLSIRLVKKFNGTNFNASEVIDGFVNNCVHIPGTNTIWTKENIAFSQEEYEGYTPEEWGIVENEEKSNIYRFFVNDWNGETWDKHEIKEGESIVLYNSENGEMREWMVVNGDLVDHLSLVNQEINKRIDGIETQIKNNDDKHTVKYYELSEALKAEENARVASDETITAETKNIVDALDTKFSEALKAEEDARVASDETITAETKNIIDALDTKFSEALKAEEDAIIASDEALNAKIEKNKITAEDTSVIIVDGTINENNVTTPTTIKVKIDLNCEHIKLGENGIYFDGNFGTF